MLPADHCQAKLGKKNEKNKSWRHYLDIFLLFSDDGDCHLASPQPSLVPLGMGNRKML